MPNYRIQPKNKERNPDLEARSTTTTTTKYTNLIIISRFLTAEPIESPSLPLQGIDDIHGHHGLPPCVLSVGHGITDHVLQKDLKDATCLLVDQIADMLHSTPASQTTNRRLRDPLDVIVKNLTASFRSSLAQTLASLSTSRHFFEKLKEQ